MLLFPEERVKLRGELVDLALALLPVLPPGQDDPAKPTVSPLIIPLLYCYINGF
jgi:hypothetical protein